MTSAPHPRFSRRRWAARFTRLRTVWVVLGVLGVAGVLGWLVWGTSLLGVRHVEVAGASDPLGQQVRDAAAITEGTPLARLDTGAVAARLERLPEVDSATVRRDWPRSVVIAVRERVPVAVVRGKGSAQALDREGMLFRRYDRGEAPSRLPVVRLSARAADRAEALREVAVVVTSLDPTIVRDVTEVHAASMDSITLAMADGDQVRWGSGADAAEKAAVLAQLLRQDASVYDVTAPDRPTTSS